MHIALTLHVTALPRMRKYFNNGQQVSILLFGTANDAEAQSTTSATRGDAATVRNSAVKRNMGITTTTGNTV